MILSRLDSLSTSTLSEFVMSVISNAKLVGVTCWVGCFIVMGWCSFRDAKFIKWKEQRSTLNKYQVLQLIISKLLLQIKKNFSSPGKKILTFDFRSLILWHWSLYYRREFLRALGGGARKITKCLITANQGVLWAVFPGPNRRPLIFLIPRSPFFEFIVIIKIK